jgi:hypothetical protein
VEDSLKNTSQHLPVKRFGLVLRVLETHPSLHFQRRFRGANDAGPDADVADLSNIT